MGYEFADPTREADKHALPNVDTFSEGPHAGDMAYHYPRKLGGRDINPCTICGRLMGPIQVDKPSWRHVTCLPDSDPFGPFDTYELALKDAQEQEA